MFIIKKGWYTLTINDISYNISAGSILVIDSFDVHSYDFKDNSLHEDCVILLPYEFRAFLIPYENKKIACPVIKSGSLAGELIEIVDKYMGGDEAVKSSALTLICSLISKNLSFMDNPKKEDVTLMRKVLAYIEQNFKGDVSRGKIASALGYTESYISHVFHRYVNEGLSEYVNKLRLIYVANTLKNSDKPVTEIIYEAGFKSQQTYYRVKAKYNLPDTNKLWNED